MKNNFSLQKIENSELFEDFKRKNLKGPNALAYDPRDWIDAMAATSNPTARDFTLLHAALYFGSEFKKLRSYIEGNLPKLTIADAVDFVVAAANIQANTVIGISRKKSKKINRDLNIRYIGDTGEIKVNNIGNQYISPDDMMSKIVDSIATILYRVSDVDRSPSPNSRKNALCRARVLVGYGSIEHGLKELWDRAVWDGCTLKKYGNGFVFAANDEALAKLWLAWQRRFETVILQEEHLRFGQAIVQDERRLRQPILTHNVVCIDDRSGRKQEYRIGKARRGGSEQASTLGAIKATYLSSFLDEVLPAYQHVGLTYLNLWQAWWVLQEIANVHQARMPSRGMLTWKHVDSYALRFSVSRATKAIASALGLPPSSAEAVMEIFTTDPNLMDSKNANDLFQQNTWGRPIVRSPNEDRGRIVLASLRSPNPVMTMERWMMRTGMTDDSGKGYKKTERGRVFERVVRERLEAVRVTSECLRGFRVAQLSARGDGAEQIDLLLQFGSTIAVCEVKCFNVPFSPLDRYNHLRKIKGAVSQANRKAEWARGNPTSILSALSVPKGERDRPWRFVPLVVLNTAYGAGLTLDGCAVTDVDWLSTFLGSPKISVSGLFERGRRASMEIRTVYRDQADLERRFAEVAVSPPSLASELDRIEWELIPFPTSSGEALLLRVPVSTGIPGMSPPQ